MRLILFILLLPGVAFAATNIAASTSSADVQSAVNASSDGDTVIIPAGTATWTSKVTAGPKQLTIFGAGRDSTVITWVKSTQLFGDAPIWWEVNGTKGVRVSQIGFIAYSNALNGCVMINGSNNACRVDNCKFTIANLAGSCRGVVFRGSAGLIDHCYFYAPSNTTAQGCNADGQRTNTWSTPHTYGGTNNTVYVEDCVFDFTFQNDSQMDSYFGSNLVFRNNLCTNSLGLGGHGTDSGGLRSPRSFEIYNNVFHASVNIAWPVSFRGGSGVVFSNTITGSGIYNYAFNLTYYRADGNNSDSFLAPWGHVTGSNYFDGNFSNGYPALDQPGAGSFPNGTTWPNPAATSYAPSDYEPVEGIYQWGNLWHGTNWLVRVATSVVTNAEGITISDLIKPNRDYFDNVVKPGYTPLVYPHPLNTGASGGGGGSSPGVRVTRGNIGRIIPAQ